MFIGDEPSTHNKSANLAFEGSQSGRRLNEWATILSVTFKAYNSDDPVSLRAYIRSAQVLSIPVITLGEKALERVSECVVENDFIVSLYSLPHPSGLNRKLNDKRYMNSVLKACKDWLNIEEYWNTY